MILRNLRFALSVMLFPFRVYLYFQLPWFCAYFVLLTIFQQLSLLYEVSLRRSPLFRQFIRQLTALLNTLIRIFRGILKNKPSNTLHWIFLTFIEAILAYIYSFTPSSRGANVSRQFSFELVSYEEDLNEEMTPENKSLAAIQRMKMNRVMHNYVPSNTFRARVRSRVPRAQSFLNLNPDDAENSTTLYSPSSFPSTPHSLARVMSRTSDRVDDVMYTARDKLRLQEAYASNDAISKSIIKEAKYGQNLAAFDPTLVSNGLFLSSGNHCAQKLGRGLCNSCRSTIPILPDVFIYFEFSITTSSENNTPLVAIGLAPPDCPLNVMVGSWAQSVGLYTDGNLLVGSRWSNNTGNISVSTGDTIGVLTRLASSPSSSSSSSQKKAKSAVVEGLGEENSRSEDSDDDADFYVPSNPLHAVYAISRFLGFSKDEDASVEPTPPSFPSSLTQPLNADVETDNGISSALPFVCFNVNGIPLSFPDSVIESVRNEIKNNPPLYPTVSLLSEQTKIWCRFDKADIIYQSRESIGAPQGCRIYCLDGSLLLSENQETDESHL